MKKPQKSGGPKLCQAFDKNGDTRWTCWQAADGESTRGWGRSPNDAYGNWLCKTLIAEGATVKQALKLVAETNFD